MIIINQNNNNERNISSFSDSDSLLNKDIKEITTEDIINNITSNIDLNINKNKKISKILLKISEKLQLFY